MIQFSCKDQRALHTLCCPEVCLSFAIGQTLEECLYIGELITRPTLQSATLLRYLTDSSQVSALNGPQQQFESFTIGSKADDE